jgi:hypothetical protein
MAQRANFIQLTSKIQFVEKQSRRQSSQGQRTVRPRRHAAAAVDNLEGDHGANEHRMVQQESSGASPAADDVDSGLPSLTDVRQAQSDNNRAANLKRSAEDKAPIAQEAGQDVVSQLPLVNLSPAITFR